MTKKDYWLIADTIYHMATPAVHKPAIASAFATTLRTDNPRFDEKTFMDACLNVRNEDRGAMV